MRASSLDASLLDTELQTLLLSPLHEALKLFHPTLVSNCDPELVALLRLALWKVGIWDSNASYGSLIQNLHFRTIRTLPLIFVVDVDNGRSVPPTTAQKLAYGGFTVVLPYLLSKVEAWLTLSNDIAPAAWKDRLQQLITNAENTYSTLSLLNFLAFLVNGRYRSLPDRILKLRLLPLTKSQPHHLLSYEFLNRQLTWTSLTEFLLFILPLILPSYRRIRRRLLRSIKPDESQLGALAELPIRFCAICFSKGREGRLITNPYCGECGHPYCYTCLMEEVAAEEGDGWPCLRCGHVIRHIKRWEETLEDDETAIEEKEHDAETVQKQEEQEEQESSQSEEVLTPEDEAAELEEEDSNEEENLFSRRY